MNEKIVPNERMAAIKISLWVSCTFLYKAKLESKEFISTNPINRFNSGLVIIHKNLSLKMVIYKLNENAGLKSIKFEGRYTKPE